MNGTLWALRRNLPNALTALGHLASLLWLLWGAPYWVGLVGLLLDAADGFAARRLDAATETGSLYDWSVDITLAAVLASRLGEAGLVLLLALVPLQVWLRREHVHLSGRAALTLATIVAGAR